MEADSINFLVSYLEEAIEKEDAFSISWVAIQIGLHAESSVEDIKQKLKKTLQSTTAAERFNV